MLFSASCRYKVRTNLYRAYNKASHMNTGRSLIQAMLLVTSFFVKTANVIKKSSMHSTKRKTLKRQALHSPNTQLRYA